MQSIKEAGKCPQCQSQNIDYPNGFDLDTVIYRAVCLDCGCVFNECYELNFVENIIIEKGAL